MKKVILTVASFCLMAGIAVFAQPAGNAGSQDEQQGPGQAPEQLTTEEIAARLTDEMNTTLDLTQKQYKKLSKFNLKDQQEQEELLGNFAGPRPGGPNGGPGMGGPGGQGGQGGQGGPGMGPQGNGPQGTPDLSELEDYWAKKEKKLRKILTDEQFDKWYGLHPEQFGVRKNPDDKMPFDGVVPKDAPKQ